jgi:hypothetical protein
MKCYYHPKEDAIAVCKACGKGVCHDCLVTVSGDSYCKQCVETGRANLQPVSIPSAPELVARPSGTPSRTMFILGSVGLIIAGVAAILSIFRGLGDIWAWGNGFGDFGIVSTVILAVGLLLAGFGYRGIKRNYGKGIGTAGFVFGILAFAFLVVEAGLAVAIPYNYYYNYYYGGYYNYNSWFIVVAIFAIIAIEIFAVAQIIWGVAHINSRRYTGNSGLGMAAGIILIISGAFSATILLSFVGFILFLVGAILAMIVLLMAKIPRLQ